MDRRSFVTLAGGVSAASALTLSRTPIAQATPPTVHSGVVGFAQDVLDPRVGPITRWGLTDGFAFDCRHRTVGLDLGTARPVNAIRLVTDAAAHRITGRDLSVLISDDNQSWLASRQSCSTSAMSSGSPSTR